MTKYHKHAVEIIRDMNAEEFKEYYAIVCCSGDGIPHEVVNGFYQRPDFENLRLRIGALMGGSACGIVSSSCKDFQIQKGQINAVYALTKARLRPLSITKYVTNGIQKVIYGFLGYYFGWIQDIDFKSENRPWKWFGANRFEVYGYFRAMKPLKRNIRLSVSEESFEEQ